MNIDCNHTYNALSGMINYYTFDEVELENCTNDIRVPDKYYLTFVIMFISLEHTSSPAMFNVSKLFI